MRKIVMAAMLVAALFSVTYVSAEDPYQKYKGTIGCSPVRGQQPGSPCYTKDNQQGYCAPTSKTEQVTNNGGSWNASGSINAGAEASTKIPGVKVSGSLSGTGSYNSGSTNSQTTYQTSKLKCEVPE